MVKFLLPREIKYLGQGIKPNIQKVDAFCNVQGKRAPKIDKFVVFSSK